MKKGTLENKFIITDFKHDITVLYKGALPMSFKEGDMASVGGFIADHKAPNCFIGTNVSANHDIAPDKWLNDTKTDKRISINMVQNHDEDDYEN